MSIETAGPTPSDDLAARLAAAFRDVPDFPSPGIVFKDICGVLADAALMADVFVRLAALVRASGAELVAGLEARGFLLAGGVSAAAGCGMVPVRKAGKLPPPTLRASYELEYGSAEIEIPAGVVRGRRVFVLDDVLATGGTLRAGTDLLTRGGATVTGAAVLLELSFLSGRAALPADLDVHALLVS